MVLAQPHQLPLNVSLYPECSLAHFAVGPNALLVSELQQLAIKRQQLLYLWGDPGVGKSYLLQALIHDYHALYLPLSELAQFETEWLHRAATAPLICVDDLELLQDLSQWHEPFLHFFDEVRQLEGNLVLAAQIRPQDLDLPLLDLASRLTWGLSMEVKPLSDEDKLAALIHRCEQLGLELEAEVGRFILQRCQRDLGGLFNLIQELDKASIAAQRRLTLPFVKAVLEI